MISKKYKINIFFLYSLLFFYLLLLVKINFIYSYNKITYNFNYSAEISTKQVKLDFNHFNKTRLDLEERVYKNGSDIYKRYPINISNNSKILEYTLLYKKTNFYNKQLIIHQKLSEDFRFNYRIINLNFNFIIVHFLKTLLIIFMLIIFFKWAYYFNTKFK
jgi:hypothetical protein